MNTFRRRLYVLTHWEFWSFHWAYLPVYAFYLLKAIRSGAPGWFCSVNPSMANSGMFGNTKMAMYAMLPEYSYPKTIFIKQGTSWEEAKQKLQIPYPIMLKPDIGERGYRAVKANREADWKHYHSTAMTDYLVQSYIDLPVEISIFYYRIPGELKGHITSVVGKKLLRVVGDGKMTLRDLILNYPRAALQVDRLKGRWGDRFNEVIAEGEVITLIDNANHSKGAEFYLMNEEIDEALLNKTEELLINAHGFCYGRFDIRCTDVQSFRDGTAFSVIELNGLGAEPLDMYIPEIPLKKGISILMKHWRIVGIIAAKNHQSTYPYERGFDVYKRFAAYRKLVQHS